MLGLKNAGLFITMILSLMVGSWSSTALFSSTLSAQEKSEKDTAKKEKETPNGEKDTSQDAKKADKVAPAKSGTKGKKSFKLQGDVADIPAKKDAVDEDDEDFKVPADGGDDELLSFMNKMNQDPEGLAPMQFREFKRKSQTAVIEAATKLIENPKASDKHLLAAVQFKMDAFMILSDGMGDKNARKQLIQFLEEIKTDKRKVVSDEAKLFTLLLQAKEVLGKEKAEKKDVAKLVADFQKEYKSVGSLSERHLFLAFKVCEALSALEYTESAIVAYRELGSLFEKKKEPQIANAGAMMVGASRRLGLVGKPIEVKGKTIAGKDFDLASLKGKVILVDFWATWCQPCMAEIPNILEMHEKYHEKGFEVVGICLDDPEAQKDVEKFLGKAQIPWTTLFSTDPEAAGSQHPLAKHYGILAIPQAILVAQDGKVVTLQARGEDLATHLEKLLDKDSAKDDDKNKKSEKKVSKEKDAADEDKASSADKDADEDDTNKKDTDKKKVSEKEPSQDQDKEQAKEKEDE